MNKNFFIKLIIVNIILIFASLLINSGLIIDIFFVNVGVIAYQHLKDIEKDKF